MKKLTLANKNHTKLFLLTSLIILAIAGYFVYKYSYIYLERGKYDQATVSIQKVAADLKSQGIDTEFSKGCGRTQVVSGLGAITCDTGITTKNTSNDDEKILNIYKETLSKNNFAVGSKTISLPDLGTANYTLKGNSLSCGLTYSKSEQYSQFDFGCGNNEKFKLF